MSVAKSLPHDAAPLHVTGSARYVDDIPLPAGTVHLAFGVSDVAHGSIKAMDLSAVREAPGVLAVLSAKDLPFANDVSPSPSPEPLLATDRAHFVGQPLFLVVATDHLAARKAARLGAVDIEPLPTILTLDEAMAADSRFEDGPRVYQKGDAATAIDGATHQLAGTIEIGGQEHFYLEGQAAAALPQEGGDMVVYSSSQHPTEIQHKVADALGVPMNAVRVEVRRMGGGFGGKESQGNALAVSCAVVAAKLGRPTKMRYDRDDDMVITGKRHDFRISYRVGYESDGRIVGVDFVQLCRCGWSMDLSLPVADRAMLHADNAYAIPNLRVESHRLKTNTQSNTAFRGFGGPQGMVGIERVLDHVAHAVGRDPVYVRRLNYYAAPKPSGAGTGTRFGGTHSPDTTEAGGDVTHYGMPVADFILDDLTEQLLQTSDYAARKEAVQAWNGKNKILKKGIAFSPVKFGISFTLTHLNQAGALVHVYQDGSIHLNHGGTEMGQGLFQKVAQVAAARFGVDLQRVKITATDTAKVPNTSATAASSGSDLNGMAVQAACDTICDRLAEFVAARAQADAATVRFEGGMVHVGGEALPFDAVIKDAYMARVSLSSTGFYATPKVEWDRIKGQGRPFFYFAYGAAVSEVVIDTLTGENRILRADVLHDCGASLNPALDIGQIEGGYVQGAGWLTTEELVWDGQGKLQTHAPSTYKIPACSDRPDVFNVALWCGANPEETVYRSKAVGEPPLMLGISALLALSDAVAACGSDYPALDAPATAEQVFHAVKRVQR
jgi:xanthine dehydrogenase large subunit